MGAEQEMAEKPLGKLLFKMCSHTTLSLMIYSLYSAADTFFVSHGVGTYAAGAVSMTMPLLILLSAVSTMAGSGGASCISRALGGGDKDKAAKVTANAFLVFWGLAVLVTAAGILFLDTWLNLFGVPADLWAETKIYARIILAGAVTSTGFSSFMRAEGDTKYSLLQWVIPVVCNIVLDVLFIFTFQMGVAGAAYATVLAQMISVSMSFWFFFVRKKRAYTIRRFHFRLDLQLVKEILLIGSPAFLIQVASAVLIMIVNKRLGIYGGAVMITAYGFVTKVQNILFIPQQGIAQGIQPVVGYNYAKRNRSRAEKTMKLAFISTAVYGGIAAVTGIICRTTLVSIFTSEQILIQAGAAALVYIVATAPLKGFSGLVSVYYQAVGDARTAIAIPVISIACIQIPMVYFLSEICGQQGIWLSFPLSDLLVFIMAFIYYKYRRNRHI